MKIITFLNEKGGIGKTTMTTVLAAILAYFGYRVLIIDIDPQGHVGARFGLKPMDGTYYAFTQKQDTQQAWNTLVRGLPPAAYGREGDIESSKLWLLQGSGLTKQLANNFSIEQVLKLKPQWDNHFDFVLFDTSPQIGAIHSALMVASDYLILPTECTRLSITGLNTTIKHYRQLRRNYDEELAKQGLQAAEILGILPTRFTSVKSVHHQNLGWIQGRYGEEYPDFVPIRMLTDWEKAESKLQPVFVYNPRGRGAADAIEFAEQVLDRIGVPAHEYSA